MLKDSQIADQVIDQLKRAPELGAQDELTGPALLSRLTFTPLQGTPYVDLSFSDGEPEARRGRGPALRPAVRQHSEQSSGRPS